MSGSTFTGSTSRTRVAICLSADTPASVISTSTTVVAMRGALIGSICLMRASARVNQVGRLKCHAVAGAVLDLLPKRLEVLAQLDFLPEFQLTPVAGIDDAILEDLAVDLVDDLGAEIANSSADLQFEMRVLGIELIENVARRR